MFESPCWKKAEAKLWMKAEMKFISWKMAEINQGSNVMPYPKYRICAAIFVVLVRTLWLTKVSLIQEYYVKVIEVMNKSNEF